MEQIEKDKLQAEKERLIAEKNKLDAEKNAIVLDSKYYWRKPIIIGLTWAITMTGFYAFLHGILYTGLKDANTLVVEKGKYENQKMKDSLEVHKDSLKILMAKNNLLDSSLKSQRDLNLAIQKDLNQKQKLLYDTAFQVNTTVLWIDDKPSSNTNFGDYLTNEGYEIINTISTSDASVLIKRGGIDKIISDMGRNEGNKYNPRAGLKVIDISGNIPLIFYSSKANNSEIVEDLKKVSSTIKITSNVSDILDFLKE